jgi:hypothetical protein
VANNIQKKYVSFNRCSKGWQDSRVDAYALLSLNEWLCSVSYRDYWHYGYVSRGSKLSLGRRSGSIVAEESNIGKSDTKLCYSYEKTQSQRIEKYAEALLELYKVKLFKGLQKVRQIYTVENLTKVIIAYSTVANNKVERINSIYNIFVDPCFLFLAYSMLRKNLAVGFGNVVRRNVVLVEILKLTKTLETKKYYCMPKRKVYVSDINSKRFLVISSTNDKIILKALQMLIFPAFDAIFLDFSHGFRPEKSCHTALNSIFLSRNNTTWFIELVLLQAFKQIHQQILIKEIRSQIKEELILDLIDKILNVGHVNLQKLIDSKLEGHKETSQELILSPLFVNIFFHKIDV